MYCSTKHSCKNNTVVCRFLIRKIVQGVQKETYSVVSGINRRVYVLITINVNLNFLGVTHKVISLFERKCQGLIFDNAPSHMKKPDDALNVDA